MDRRTGTSPKGEARREEILRTAFRVLADGKHRVPTLRGIGRELGVEPAQILYYFPSLEQLLTAVIERWDLESTAPDQGRSLLDALGAAVRRNLELPGVVRVYLTLAAEATDPRHPAHRFFAERFARVHRGLADAVRAEQRRGAIPTSVDADATAHELVALADGLQLQALFSPEVDVTGRIDAAIAALRRPVAQAAPS